MGNFFSPIEYVMLLSTDFPMRKFVYGLELLIGTLFPIMGNIGD